MQLLILGANPEVADLSIEAVPKLIKYYFC